MTISMDEAITQVARKNGHGLQPDDPVLFLVTIMNCIAEGYDKQNAGLVEKYGAYLEKYRQFHQEAALQWRNDAKAFATNVLNTGLASGRDAAAKLMAEGAAKVLVMVREELGREMAAHLFAQQEEFQRLKRHLAWMAGVTGASLLSAVLMVWLL